jgi:hypothetical protein
VSPTIFKEGRFRFFFFSREEPRPHVHVDTADGQAKFWLDPLGDVANNYGLSTRDLKEIVAIIEARQQEIRDAWDRHFGR